MYRQGKLHPRILTLFSKHYWRETFEAVLILGVISILGAVLPPTWLQLHLIFCIFFLIVFVTAIRRYALTTYVVDLFATGYYAFLLWQHFPTGLGLTTLQMLIEPFILFVSGFIIGDVLRSQRHQLVLMQQQQIENEALLEEMRQRHQATQINNTELERRHAKQAVSVSTVSEKIVRLCGLKGQEQYDAIIDIVTPTINANFCALYMPHNGCMTLCASQMIEANDRNTVDLELDAASDILINYTMQNRRVCTIHDVLTDSRPARRPVGIMAGPLVNRSNQIIGIVIVDDIPLLTFLPSTVHLFESLLCMIQIAVQARILGANMGPAIALSSMLDTEMKGAQPIMSDAKITSFRDNDKTEVLSVIKRNYSGGIVGTADGGLPRPLSLRPPCPLCQHRQFRSAIAVRE